MIARSISKRSERSLRALAVAACAMSFVGCSAGNGQEGDAASLDDALRCNPASLANLPTFCNDDSKPLIAASPASTGAPQIQAGVTYGVHLVTNAGARNQGGALTFTAKHDGLHVLYLGTPLLPLEIEAVDSSEPLVASCVSAIDKNVCQPLRRAFAFELQGGQSYRISLGPIAPEEWVRLRLEAPSDNDSIVFAAALNGAANSDLYTVDPDGTNLTRLTNTPDDDEQFPRWSPNRSHVAYMRGGSLIVADHDGSNDHVVTSTVGRNGVGITAPAWSPDGLRLVYSYPRSPFVIGDGDDSTDESYRTTLHVIHADGTNDTPIPEPPHGLPPGIGTLTEPAWSSTGVIAFLEADDCPDCAGGATFATIREDGSDYTQVLVDTFNQPGHDVDWSPDASHWAYTELNPRDGRIGVSLPDGTNAQEITTAASRMPRWSPDGSHIAFVAPSGIIVTNPDGSGQAQVFAASDIRGIDW